MKSALLRYRVMANIVGVLLIILVLIGLPLNELHRVNASWFPAGSDAQQLGSNISQYLGVAHGWLYMIFLVMAALLARKSKWAIPFTVTTLLAGTIPILSFWAEHRATKAVRAAEAANTSATS